tara:strand:- start:2919 stop:4142 length:1224 start_codon:yes stop_codon:yes gene_type:complete
MKNIIIINHFAGIPGINASGKRHFNFAKVLSEEGYNVSLITSKNNYQVKNNNLNKSFLHIDGVNVHFVDEFNSKKVNLFVKLLRAFSFSFNLNCFLKRRFSKEKIDLVMASSPDLFTAFVGKNYAKQIKAKFLLEIRDIWPLTQQIIHRFSRFHPVIVLFKLIEKNLYKNADHIISNLRNFNEYLIQNKISKPFSHIHAFEVSNDNKKLDSLLYDKLPQISNYKHFGIYAGTIGKLYRLEQIIENFPVEASSEVAIIFIGSGDNFLSLKNKLSEIENKNFFLLDRTEDKSQLLYLYEKASFGISLSNNFEELYKYGLNPVKVFDYMKNSLFTIGIGPYHYAGMKNSKGLISIPFNDKIAFEDIILKIRDMDKSEIKKLGRKNKEFGEKYFSSTKALDKIISIVRSLI